MCQPVPCESCGKITWSGCGEHIAEVKAVVPADQWCDGHAESAGGGFMSRILGR